MKCFAYNNYFSMYIKKVKHSLSINFTRFTINKLKQLISYLLLVKRVIW